MKRLIRLANLAAALACAAVALPARADFYTLEGRFQCLDKPGAVCFDATPMPRDPPPPESREPEPPQAAPIVAPIVAEAPSPPPALEVKPPVDPVLAAAHRIEIEKPEAGDVAILRRRRRPG